MNIKSLISDAVSVPPPPRAVEELIACCRKIAVVFLRKKEQHGRLNLRILGLNLEDAAIDCISELFSRDESGSLIQIKTYFDGLAADQLSEQDLLIHLRRIVFSRVNQSIFKRYKEADPSLGKILRNLKLALQTMQMFRIVDRFGEPCLIPATGETLEHLPALDASDLDSLLRRYAHGNEDIPTLLAHLSRALREQSAASRIVPLMAAAQTIRTLYETAQCPDEPGGTGDDLLASDTAVIIDRTWRKFRRDYAREYVGTSKLPQETYDKYFEVILEHLTLRFLRHDGEDCSYYKSLQALLPGLTREEYLHRHKARLEYLSRIVTAAVISELKEQL